MKLSKFYSYVVMVVSLVLLTGCANTDAYVYGEPENLITVFPHKASNRNVTRRLVIGCADKPYEALQQIKLRCPDGKVFDLSKFNRKTFDTYYPNIDFVPKDRLFNRDKIVDGSVAEMGFAKNLSIITRKTPWQNSHPYIRPLMPKRISTGEWEDREAFLTMISLWDLQRRQGIDLLLQKDKVLMANVRARGYKKRGDSIQISVAGSKWYKFPLTKAELKKLFGEYKKEFSYCSW